MPGVDTKHPSYKELEEQWERCRDCVSGGDAVKVKKTKYLPALDSHKKESVTAGTTSKYDEYVLRALFYNATGRTVAGLSGGIFQKAPSVEVDPSSKEDIKDITLTGEPIDMFALHVTREHLTTGRTGILIDMSSEESTTPRPYWVCYKAEEIINWRFEKMGGDQELCLVVLKEFIQDPTPSDKKDEFDNEKVVQYRVLRLTNSVYTQQVYIPIRGTDARVEYVGQKILTPVRRGKALDFIPFALPWAINAPPLIDLVDVNLSHYRGVADLKHGLHFTALPTPWVSGQQGDSSKPLAIGSGTAWSLDINGKAGMLEFTGKGLGAIRSDLQDMQRQMATLGARLLEEAPHYAETALSVSMRHSSDYATLRTIAQVVEQQISWALKVHCWWKGSATLVADVTANLELNKIFFDQSMTADELRALLLALQGNSISYATFYARLAAAGLMREGIDEKEELAEIKKDGDQFLVVKPGQTPPDPKSTAPGSKPVPKPH